MRAPGAVAPAIRAPRPGAPTARAVTSAATAIPATTMAHARGRLMVNSSLLSPLPGSTGRPSVLRRASSTRAIPGERELRRDLAPGFPQQLPQDARPHFRQPHEHRRIAGIVIGDVEDLGRRLHELVTFLEPDAKDERFAILLQPRQEPPPQLEA